MTRTLGENDIVVGIDIGSQVAKDGFVVRLRARVQGPQDQLAHLRNATLLGLLELRRADALALSAANDTCGVWAGRV